MLLSHGCGDDTSFGRVATLSRQLDFFFKALLTSRFAEPEGPYRHVYTIFAGGDDLMVIGPWPVLFELAGELRAWFRRLTADNPDVTLSAGLALGSGRMPVSSLAAAAEQELEAAKDAGRDRIGVFRRVLTWSEYDEALAVGRRLDRMIVEGDNRTVLKLRPGFAYRLLQYARNAERVDLARHTEQLVAAGGVVTASSLRLADLRDELTWRSHLSYDLHRNIRRSLPKDASASVREDLEWLESFLVIPVQSASGRFANVLRLAASYALYRNRGG
jgi:CRISPR-associated protein Csm1